MPHRAIVARRHALRVAMDRLPAARDKALKIIGNFLCAKTKGLSARGRSGGSQVDCTVRRRRALRRGGCRRGRDRVLLVRTLGVHRPRPEEGVVGGAAVLRGGPDLRVDGVRERVGDDVLRRGSGGGLRGAVEQRLHLGDVLDDEL